MRVAQKIEQWIYKIPAGNTFKYHELGIAPDEYAAAAKAMERLVKRDIVARASTGLFYKPKQTTFGNLKPTEEELLKAYLFKEGKRVAYITGVALYNKMGITTQVPKNIRVASNDKRIVTSIGSIKVKAVKSYVAVTDGNYYLLELLDVMKDLKIIPDADITQIIRFLLGKLKGLTEKEITTLIKTAIRYPPRVRALAGALLSKLGVEEQLTALKKSINPFTVYELGITLAQLSTITDWNIR